MPRPSVLGQTGPPGDRGTGSRAKLGPAPTCVSAHMGSPSSHTTPTSNPPHDVRLTPFTHPASPAARIRGATSARRAPVSPREPRLTPCTHPGPLRRTCTSVPGRTALPVPPGSAPQRTASPFPGTPPETAASEHSTNPPPSSWGCTASTDTRRASRAGRGFGWAFSSQRLVGRAQPPPRPHHELTPRGSALSPPAAPSGVCQRAGTTSFQRA